MQSMEAIEDIGNPKKADTIPYLDGGEQPRKSNSRLPSCDLVLSLVCVCVCFTMNVKICHTHPEFRSIWDLSRGMFELTDPPIHEFFLLRTRDTILFH